MLMAQEFLLVTHYNMTKQLIQHYNQKYKEWPDKTDYNLN